ncbi:MAG TPA: hypothetical protein VE756_15470, partial [Burkholderiales bacterium]|nr:hypothetical protein [Burkholderiales bacterium]
PTAAQIPSLLRSSYTVPPQVIVESARAHRHGGVRAQGLPVFLLPEQTLRSTFDFTVSAVFPKGLYPLTLEAFEVGDPAAPPSSATVTLTIS